MIVPAVAVDWDENAWLQRTGEGEQVLWGSMAARVDMSRLCAALCEPVGNALTIVFGKIAAPHRPAPTVIRRWVQASFFIGFNKGLAQHDDPFRRIGQKRFCADPVWPQHPVDKCPGVVLAVHVRQPLCEDDPDIRPMRLRNCPLD